MDTMTMGEKFFASIQVTVLGLIILFAALAILYLAIIIMEKLINRPQAVAENIELKSDIGETAVLDAQGPKTDEKDIINDTQLIAIITAAIAASTHIPAQKVVVKGIRRVQDPTPIWAKAGRMEQINNML